MKKKMLLPLAAALVLIVFLAADLVLQDRKFSAQENRVLAQKPVFSVEALLDGSFTKQYEDYVTDQFPGRDAFISVKAQTERLLGKKDINGVYFAQGNTLIERHSPESVDEKKAERKADRLIAQAEKIKELISGQNVLMLVPSADAVQSDRLPAFADSFDQKGWIEGVNVKASGAGMVIVDACSALYSHRDEKIYYGTDHHWTTLGAFYGYQAFEAAVNGDAREGADTADAAGRTKAAGARAELSDYQRTVVKNDFYGTLQSKVNLPVAPDEIEIFEREGEGPHPVFFIHEEKNADSCYFYERLDTKDAYAFFMDGNFPVVEMAGDGPKNRTVMVIKDSFANCFVPFLTKDYGTVWLVDPRYYRGDVTELVKQYGPKDVLYLYNIFQFIENF